MAIKNENGEEIGMKIVDQSSPENGAMYSFQWNTNNYEPGKKRKRSKVINKFQLIQFN